MFDSWTYPNVPVSDGMVLIHQLPWQFSIMKTAPVTDCHIVYRYRNENSTALCGAVVRREIHRRINMKNVCDTCMIKLNDRMEGALYDDHNNEFYLPT